MVPVKKYGVLISPSGRVYRERTLEEIPVSSSDRLSLRAGKKRLQFSTVMAMGRAYFKGSYSLYQRRSYGQPLSIFNIVGIRRESRTRYGHFDHDSHPLIARFKALDPENECTYVLHSGSDLCLSYWGGLFSWGSDEQEPPIYMDRGMPGYFVSLTENSSDRRWYTCAQLAWVANGRELPKDREIYCIDGDPFHTLIDNLAVSDTRRRPLKEEVYELELKFPEYHADKEWILNDAELRSKND